MVAGEEGLGPELDPSFVENGKTCSSKRTCLEISIFLVAKSRQ